MSRLFPRPLYAGIGGDGEEGEHAQRKETKETGLQQQV